ncbi:MAG: DUF996 domain-containing protein [bacterium]
MIEKEIIDIKNAKLLGIGGSLSQLASPYSALAGVIVLYIAMRKLSVALGKKKIADDFLLALIVSFIVVLLALIIVLLFPFLLTIFTYTNFPYWLMITLPFLIIWIGLCVSAYFIKRSFSTLSDASGEGLFRKAGEYILWGTITMVFLVGIFVLFIGQIYEVLAFFSLPDSLEISKMSEGG